MHLILQCQTFSSLVLWPFLSATFFVIGTCYIDQEVSLLLIVDIVFIFYKTLPVHCISVFFYVLKELRHLINDIKLDTVLTINKSWTKTDRAVARGKIWRFPFCACCIPLVWMEHKSYFIGNNRIYVRQDKLLLCNLNMGN